MLCGTALGHQAPVAGRLFELVAVEFDGSASVIDSFAGTQFAGPVRPPGTRLSPAIRIDHDDDSPQELPISLREASRWETVKAALAWILASRRGPPRP